MAERTKSQILAERKSMTGCCDDFFDRKGCSCLENAVDDLSRHHKEMLGVEISEVEVAKGLGFDNVIEMRRWQTELGHEVVEIRYKLRQAEDESNRFRWHMRRMESVLERCKEFVAFQKCNEPEKLLLAIDVVCGKTVDWKNELKDWGL